MKNIDVVYTWVDDRWPGYREELSRYAAKPADTDPSRTRDNLDLLRYSLRSLEHALPDLGTIYLLTCRPQIPAWLDTSHPRIRVVHHDEIISVANLPTFNSLGIISHLHLLPDLSDQFLYIEDDTVIRPPFGLGDYLTGDGRTFVFPWKYWVPQLSQIGDPAREKPWNLALARSAGLIDQRYGEARRRQICHMPILIRRADWQAVMESFAEAIDQTRRSLFRANGNVDPASLYLWTLLAEGRAILMDESSARKVAGYVPLEDFWPLTFFSLLKAKARGLRWITLNDNFGLQPSRIAERLVRRQLQAWYPDPSSFERR
jgi:Stealth protein CR2, conserved region 2